MSDAADTPRGRSTPKAPPRRELPPELNPRGAAGGRGRAPQTRAAGSGTPPRTSPSPTAGPAYQGIARSSLPTRPAGGAPPPPAGPGRARPRRRWARVLSWVAISMSVVVLGLAGGGYYLVNQYEGNITRLTDVFGGRSGDAPPPAPKNAQNILIVGSDTRGDTEAGGEYQGTGATFVTGQRSDTVILAHLYGSSDKVQLVSFPRDSYVDIPAYTDPTTQRTYAARKGKLNSAFALGGPALLVATIENLTKIRVDHYVQIDFQGFENMVNKLGGVEVCLSKPAKDKFSGIDLAAGRHTIKGKVALAFVRQRHGLAAGDIDRIKRQQQFLGAMVRKVLSSGTLLNVVKLNSFLNAATSSLLVDEELSIGDMRDLALRMRSFNAGGVLFSTIPVTDIAATRNRESVVLIDDEAATALFDALRRDVAPTTAGASPSPSTAPGATSGLIVAPANVRVEVFNGAGVQGLGRRAAADLAEVGFKIIGVPGNRGSGATETVVLHGPDKADSARTLAAAVPGAVVREDPTLGRNLQLVVGSAYSGAKAVTVSSAPNQGTTTPRTPTASATPTVKTAQDDPCTA